MKQLLNDDDGQNLSSLFASSNSIIEKYDAINEELHGFKVPSLLTYRGARILRQLGCKIECLQTEWSEFNNNAVRFAVGRNIPMPDEGRNCLPFVVSHVNLLHRISELNLYMATLIESHKTRYTEVESQRNFNLAMLFGIVSLIGLIFSLVR